LEYYLQLNLEMPFGQKVTCFAKWKSLISKKFQPVKGTSLSSESDRFILAGTKWKFRSIHVIWQTKQLTQNGQCQTNQKINPKKTIWNSPIFQAAFIGTNPYLCCLPASQVQKMTLPDFDRDRLSSG